MDRLAQFGIEGPKLLAALGIKCNQPRKRRRQIHHSVDEQRRALKSGAAGSLRVCPVAVVTRIVDPGDLQLADVFLVDLLESRVFRASRISTPITPFLSAGRSRRQPWNQGEAQTKGAVSDR